MGEAVRQVNLGGSDLRLELAQERTTFWMNLLKGATVVNIIMAVLIWSIVLSRLGN